MQRAATPMPVWTCVLRHRRWRGGRAPVRPRAIEATRHSQRRASGGGKGRVRLFFYTSLDPLAPSASRRPPCPYHLGAGGGSVSMASPRRRCGGSVRCQALSSRNGCLNASAGSTRADGEYSSMRRTNSTKRR